VIVGPRADPSFWAISSVISILAINAVVGLQGVPKKRIPNFIFDHTIKVRWVEEFHVYVP